MDKVVVHYRDGSVLKGITDDFLPHKSRFHVAPPDEQPREVWLDRLKAVFFVRDLVGDSRRHKHNALIPGVMLPGRKLRVVFQDGEVMIGATDADHAGHPGFFLTPVDPGSNNQRCFVVKDATREVSFI